MTPVLVSDLDGSFQDHDLLIDRHVPPLTLEDDAGFCWELDFDELQRITPFRIVETEAYSVEGDLAAHTATRPSARSKLRIVSIATA